MSMIIVNKHISRWSRAALSVSLALACNPINADANKSIQLDEGVSAYHAGEYRRAVALLESFAQTGHAEALYLLGSIYEMGLSVRADDAKAENYYRQSAALGHPEAQFALGMIYLSVDNEEAERWLTLALSNRHPHALYVLDALRGGQYNDMC